MKKEILKGFTMIAAMVALALVTAVASNAQSSTRIVADIPFDFTVGNQSLPSGRYEVKAVSSTGGALMIQTTDAKSSATRLSSSIQPSKNNKNNTQPRMVFHRYGERYFLAEVWSGADQTGRQLVESRQERAVARELASISTKSRRTYETAEVLASTR